MSDESRNVLVVTFEDSAVCQGECVCMCVWCVFSLCVCVVCVFVRVCMVCVCVFACVLVCVYVCSYAHTCVCVWCGWVCVHTCIHVCLCVVGVGVGVSTYMHACVCRESREPLFLPCSFSSVGGSEGIWLITHTIVPSLPEYSFSL